jgi:hypothetical protein
MARLLAAAARLLETKLSAALLLLAGRLLLLLPLLKLRVRDSLCLFALLRTQQSKLMNVHCLLDPALWC